MTLLHLSEIGVRFGGISALDDFTLTIGDGQIHGLIGPNGAGKTTAINVISGLVPAARGTLTLAGRPFQPKPRDLAGAGIARTFQTPSTFSDLSALENVLVGGYRTATAGIVASSVMSPRALGEERTLRARARRELRQVGFDAEADAAVATLPFALVRKMEVARALMTEPRLLLLDEPTAGLGAAEVAAFATMLRGLRDERGITILLVEHDVPFVFGLCTDVTALHEGRTIATGAAAAVRRDPKVIASYLGRQKDASRAGPGPASSSAINAPSLPEYHDVLEVRRLASGYGSTRILHDVSFSVRNSEIVALVGRNGAGKSTLLNTILGAPRAWSGEICWEGRRLERLSGDRIVAAGIGLVPQEGSVIARQSVDDNLQLATFGLRLSVREMRERRDELLTQFPRLAGRRSQVAGSLSGGERQMLAIAKVLMRKPRLLVLDEPSIGLAPAIVDELQAIVARLRRSSLTILIAEQNVGWVVPIADRALLLDTGTLAREGTARDLADFEALAEHYLGA